MSDLAVHAVTPDRWDDFADLFTRPGPRGGTPIPAGCWCMWWRRRTGNPDRNREAMKALVRDGREPGLLAYEGGSAVGWVAIAPREDFEVLVRSRKYGPTDSDKRVYAVTCFYVDPRAKRRGVARALLGAAVDHARKRGARAVESYPHERGDYMGSPAMFAAAGFEPVRTTSVRTIMRLALP